MPRTGSSYFCDCLGTLPGVVVPREIFNRRGYGTVLRMDGARRRLEEIVGHPLTKLDDRDLHDYFISQPVEAIESLSAAAAGQHAALMVYKIISHQLQYPKLEAILEQRRPDVFVLVRRRIDVRISVAKAQAVGKWHHRDTTGIAVEIDVDQFLAWARWADKWYQSVLSLAGELGLAVRILDYDRDVDHSPADLRRSTAKMLKEFGIRLPSGPGATQRIRERQDARTDPFRKIGNGAALRDELTARGLLDYALSPPLAERVGSAPG